MRLALFVLLLVSIPYTGMGSELVASVPKQFLGEWQADLSECGAGGSEMGLWLQPKALAYGEGSGQLRAVVARGSREIAVIADMSGEGERWLATDQFTLSVDGKSISSPTGEGQDFVRYRCPKPSGTRPNNSSKPTPLRGAA